MTNRELLREKISNSGLKYGYIASKLGLTPYGLQLKIDNKNEFRASEIASLVEILNLNTATMKQIFFNKSVINNHDGDINEVNIMNLNSKKV